MFFFIQWGTQKMQETLHGVKLNLKLPKEDGRVFNIIYDLERGELFWIPLGRWKVKKIYIQSIKSGKIYGLEDEMYNQAEKIYLDIKEKERELKRGKRHFQLVD